jgi:hypothetical protein
MNTKIFSGEPLPTAPPEGNPDRASFDRKLLDYLRRLVAKLAQAIPTDGGPTGRLQAYVSHLDTDQIVPGAVDTPVEWTKDVHVQSGIYSHSITVNPSEITILVDGVYLVNFDVTHTLKSILGFKAQLNTGSGWVDVAYSHVLDVTSDIIAPGLGTTANIQVGIPISAGTKLRMISYVISAGGMDDGTYEMQCTRIIVLRMNDSIT